VTARVPRRWMLAFNVSHTQDPRVCHYDCQPDSIGERPHARASQRGRSAVLPAPFWPVHARPNSLQAACCKRTPQGRMCILSVMGCVTAMHAHYICSSTLVLVVKIWHNWQQSWLSHGPVQAGQRIVSSTRMSRSRISGVSKQGVAELCAERQASCMRVMHERLPNA